MLEEGGRGGRSGGWSRDEGRLWSCLFCARTDASATSMLWLPSAAGSELRFSNRICL